MKTRISIFIVLFVGFVIAKAPAQLAQPYINEVSPIKITAMSGTIWSGSAQADGIESIEWQVQPFKADIQAKLDKDNFASAELSVTLSGQAQVNELYAQLTTDELQKWLPNIPIMAQGLIQISSGQAHWNTLNQTLPNQATALIKARAVDVLGTQLGDYQATVALNDKQLEAQVKSLPKAAVTTEIKIQGTLGKTAQIQGVINPETQETRELFKQFNLSNRISLTQDLSGF